MTDFIWFAVQTTDRNGRWFTDYECLGATDALLYQREIEYRNGIPCRLVQIDRAGNRIETAPPMHAEDVRQAYHDGILRYDEAIIHLYEHNGMSLNDAVHFCPE